ncbi:hypothetical protein Q1695_004091 [Nippostrongylus brasiliensis]|nr:hypothetical protein Q1695_004091 [Nippostrongylus brasiliensis]
MDDRPTAATSAQILRTASDESSDVIERAENSLEEASEQPRRRRRRRKEISKEKSSKDALEAPQSRSKSPEKAQKRGEPEGNNTKAPAQDAFLVVEPAGKAESNANLVVQSKTPKMEHDWIISTHPEKKQKMRIAEEKKSRKLDDSHWIIQTQHGEHPSARTPHLPHEISPQTPEQSSKDPPYKERKKKSRERHRKKREDKEKKNKSEERMLKALYGKERSKEKPKKSKKAADASEATTAVPWSATKTPDPTPPERRLAKTAQEPTPPVQEQTPQKSADPSPPTVQQPSNKTPTKDPSLVQPRKPKFSADDRRPSMIPVQFLNVADRQDTPPHTPQQNTPLSTPLSKEFYIPSKEPEAEPEMQPGTTASELKLARKPKAHHISYFDLQFRRSQQEAAEKAATAARAERASSGGSVVSRRRRSEHLLKATTSKSSLQMSAEVSKSVSRIRFKSARIRARRKLRHWSRYKEEGIKPTEERIYADAHSPESSDFDRLSAMFDAKLRPGQPETGGDDRWTNIYVDHSQVLRIYGSGKVVEPFDSIPRRTSVRCTRGMATVKYGRNMIEITFQNTDIQAEKRSRVGTWIFSHAKWVRTMPIVFGKTWIGGKGPAPFCLSVGAPFWVTAHQEQVASSHSGERIRDCIEIRSCFGSESPCYEMQALETEKHPLFNERIYLGRGVIRIDRSVHVPADERGRNEMSSYAWNNNANNFLQNETISVGHDESSNISHTITESATYKPKVASPVYYSTLLEAKKPVAVEEQYVIPLDSLYFALPNENRPVHLSTLATPREISEPPNESTVDADTAQAAGKAEVGGNLTPHIIKVEEPAPPLQFPAQHYLTQASEVGHAFAPLGSAPDSAYQKEELNDLVLCMDSS